MTSRRYPSRPLVGVGAVRLDEPLEHVLLIQRGSRPAEGLWSFPGGLVEAGETARQACLRELREETGLEARLQDVATVVERIVEDDRGRVEYHFVIIDFWGYAGTGALAARSDARQARWVALGELAELPTTRGIAEAVQRALALARGQQPATPLFGEAPRAASG